MERKWSQGIAAAVVFVLIFGVYFFVRPNTNSEKPVLRILTYSSFVSLYGPGRLLKEEFEKQCSCKIHWIKGEDSTGLIQRLALNIKVDLIIGLDQLSLLKTNPSLWKSVSLSEKIFIPEMQGFLNSPFVPINWAPIGWIYKADLSHSLNDISDMPLLSEKISFPDPHSSTLGLQFYYWIYTYFSKDKEKIKSFLQKLKPRVYGSIASWSLAYGFFQKGHVALSLSYLTSLAYHIHEERSDEYRFAYFKNGHPYQVEFAAIPESCFNCREAEAFVKFLLSPQAQSLIMNTHYMFPVIKNVRKKVFADLLSPALISYKDMESFHSQKTELLKLWRHTLY